MSQCICREKLHALYRQLAWHAGSRLQASMLAAYKGKTVQGLEVTPWALEDVLENPYQLDKHLVRYVGACKELASDCRAISICTDKSIVCGLTLQNSLIVLPHSNAAVVCPPQVDSISTRVCLCMRPHIILG